MPETQTTSPSPWWGRLQQAARRTREQLRERLGEVLQPERRISAGLLSELEAILLGADVGVEGTREVLGGLRERLRGSDLPSPAALRAALREELAASLRSSAPATETGPPPGNGPKPYVVFLVGVNGTGKTTTVAKLAHRWQCEGKRVLLCAADTFRAAAGEQLQVWAGRLQADLVRSQGSADPAAVVFDALEAASSRGVDVVLVDTAGRLHTRSNLMAELEKMKRTAAKRVEGGPHEILLVLDATTGQNGLAQARQFTERVGVTGIVLTKLDGTAKGGIVIAIGRALHLPIRYLGTGEQLEDLIDFDPDAYAASLLD